MLPNLFAHPLILIQGLAAGIILGILFQKARLSQFNVIVGQLLLKDFTVLKVILTAIVVGSIGIYAFIALDLPLQMHDKGGSILSTIIGGSMFGIGMATLGFCPGTCLAAAGHGTRSAWWGIVGMLFGAWAYAETHEFFAKNVLTAWKMETATLQQLFNTSPWTIIIIMTIVSLVIFKLLGRKKATGEQPEE